MGWQPTHAMILAAGLGTRMQPLTSTIPKPLVRLAGKPLIDHVLTRLAAAGISDVVVNVHHLADLLEAHLAGITRPRIHISDERDRLLDSGGGVVKALPMLASQPFIIHNCDAVWVEGVGSNLHRLAQTWDEAAMDCLLLLAPTIKAIGYQGRGDFALDPLGRIRRPERHEIVPFAFSGVSIAHPRLFDAAPVAPFSLNRVWDRAIASGRAFGVRMEGWWMHVGDPAALAAAEEVLSHDQRR